MTSVTNDCLRSFKAVTYGSGLVHGKLTSKLIETGLFIFCAGEEYTDTVTIGSSAIKNQGIGVASIAIGFSGVDGILGVGPKDLTAGKAQDKSSCD